MPIIIGLLLGEIFIVLFEFNSAYQHKKRDRQYKIWRENNPTKFYCEEGHETSTPHVYGVAIGYDSGGQILGYCDKCNKPLRKIVQTSDSK